MVQTMNWVTVVGILSNTRVTVTFSYQTCSSKDVLFCCQAFHFQNNSWVFGSWEKENQPPAGDKIWYRDLGKKIWLNLWLLEWLFCILFISFYIYPNVYLLFLKQLCATKKVLSSEFKEWFKYYNKWAESHRISCLRLYLLRADALGWWSVILRFFCTGGWWLQIHPLRGLAQNWGCTK